MNLMPSKVLRLGALGLSAAPLILWPGFLIAGAMPPQGGWGREGWFGVFVYFSLLYPAFFFGFQWLSKRTNLAARPLLPSLIALVPFIMFVALLIGSGTLSLLLGATGHG